MTVRARGLHGVSLPLVPGLGMRPADAVAPPPPPQPVVKRPLRRGIKDALFAALSAGWTDNSALLDLAGGSKAALSGALSAIRRRGLIETDVDYSHGRKRSKHRLTAAGLAAKG